jgi:hypothetical protein
MSQAHQGISKPQNHFPLKGNNHVPQLPQTCFPKSDPE